MRRSVALCIVLSVITCGIYGIYWMIVLNDEINAATGRPGPTGGVVFLLTLITCGLYGLYWMYKMGEQVDIMRGTPGGSTPLIYILLSIFSLGIIAYALMQSELNRYCGYNE